MASKSTSRSASRTSSVTVALGVALAAGCGAGQRGGHVRADLVLVGGQVTTLDDAHPSATAIAVRGDRIAAVGSDAEVRAFIGPDTRVIELAGRAVTPGLVDSHAHLYGLGVALDELALKDASSEVDAARRAAEAAAKLPAGEWLLGRGWDQNRWPGQKFPTAASLDAVIADRPVVLRRVDGHAVWLNSAALKLAGVGATTADPAGGRLERDAAGAPTGVLIDNAMALIDDRLPPATLEVRQRRILAAARLAVAAGLTGVHEMGIDDATADVYRSLADEARLPLRVYAFLEGDPRLAEGLARRVPEIDRDGSQWFVLRGVKLFADGALGSRGARLLAPYSDAQDQSGLWVTPPGDLARAVQAATDAGFQVAIHAIGDAGVRAALDAFQAAGKQPGDRRFRVEHAQVVAPADLPRFAALGVIASMQPTHATSDMPWAEARLGAERLKGAYAWRSMIASGAHLCAGSDFPVEELSPLLGLYAAVTRQDAAGNPPGGWLPEQKLTLTEALRAYTVEAAYASFSEASHGRITPGFVADLTVFDRPLVPDRSLLTTQVALTIVGGRVVFERK